jgi:hypothetical protein
MASARKEREGEYGSEMGRYMAYSIKGYLARAEECVRVANLTGDEMLRGAILRLRQSYLRVAHELKVRELSTENRDQKT